MTEREKIFARIREALSVKAPLPGHHDTGHRVTPPAAPTAQAREWLPAVGDSFEDQLARFRANAADLKAAFYFCNHRDELTKLLTELRDVEGWKKIASHNGELTNAACSALALPLLQTDQPFNPSELEACDAGITECDALIAQTGSVLITNRSAGGRALSVLPPHHVVLVRREQLLRDLPAAFELLKKKYAANYPSMISFITGPSRTGDIERILVLGAHGPKKLTIFCL
ncbi:MAG TPA: LUD domain-containing protein [Verrucomicrobiae bacterium]|jgi:L-lactate dehydrogenase complex protein LldG|nr:LUD domain-containing protein [Verrucomicrobiae bacterium]